MADRIIKESKYSVTENFRSFFGIYNFGDVSVEVMGEFQYLLKNGLWSIQSHLNEVLIKEYKGMLLPMLTLKQELKVYQNLWRVDKVEKIKAAMKESVK